MAHDGSYEVAWKGKAFPFLMHHPNSFLQTENYGTARHAGAEGHGHSGGHGHGHSHGHAATAAADGESVFTAGTGTWNGPAPRGYQGNKPPAEPAAPQPVVSVTDPDSVRLPSGAAMPLVGLSTQGVKSADEVKSALDNGCRHFDCAERFGNEAVVGEGLRAFIGGDVAKRPELFVSSKAWNTHHRPTELRAACERSLAVLGVTYLDLYLLHWPEAWAEDVEEGSSAAPKPDTAASIQETWQAMEKLVDDGLVRHLGVANFGVKQVEELLGSCRVKPVVNQVELHPLLPQRKLVGVCYRKGVQCVSTCPMGASASLASNALVAQVAKESGKTVEQVLLKYNLQRGVPTLLDSCPSNSSLTGEMFSWRLTNAHKALLDTLENGQRFVSPAWKQWPDAEEGGAPKPSLLL